MSEIQNNWPPCNEDIIELYINRNMDFNELAIFFNVSKSAVASLLFRRKIKKPMNLRVKKQKENVFKKYGVTSTLLLEEVRGKGNETCLEKYGVSSIASAGGLLSPKNVTEETTKKRKETIIERYGVEKIMDIPGVKEKIKATNLFRYGTDNPLKSEEIKQRICQTNTERYGSSNYTQSDYYSSNNAIYKQINLDELEDLYVEQNLSLQDLCNLYNIKEGAMSSFLNRNGITKPKELTYVHRKKTNIRKYGAISPAQNDSVKQKMASTCIEKYGYKCSLSSPIVREKISKTLRQNETVRTSKQQIKMFELLKNMFPGAQIILNKAVGTLNLDIEFVIDNCKIDVEYDGWYWHRDKNKDLKRDYYLYSLGYKILRIHSGTLIPTEEELKDSINFLINTEHHHKILQLKDWKEN